MAERGAAAERHARHEERFKDYGDRIVYLETASTQEITWRTGNEAPHRGAESRLTGVEAAIVQIKDNLLTKDVMVATLRKVAVALGALITLVGGPPAIIAVIRFARGTP